MTYTLNNFDGSFFAKINDGTINNTSSSLTFVGRNYANYGNLLDENFLYLMQNFSDMSPPSTPVVGQLWWNSSSRILNIYTGNTYKSFNSTYVSNTTPAASDAVVGDLWFDTQDNDLALYTGNGNWLTIGPSVISGTGARPNTIPAIPVGSYEVIELLVNNNVVGIISAETFTPNTPIPGIPSVQSGLTLTSNIGGTGSLAGIVIGGALSANNSYGNAGDVLTSGGGPDYPAYWVPGGGSGTVRQVTGIGTVAGLSLKGNVVTTGSISLVGNLNLSNPPVIGNSNPNSAAFTDLTIGATLFDRSASGGAIGQVLTSGGNTVFWANSPAVSGTVFQVSGTGNVSGISLTGNVTSYGALTLGGTLELDDNQVVTALGYIPAPATAGTSILAADGSGGFNSVIIGAGLLYSSGVLYANGGSNTSGTVTSVSGTGTVGGLSLTGTVTTAGSLTLGGTLTSGSSILAGNGSGGIQNVTIGSGLSYSGGILTATGGNGGGNTGGTVTSVTGTGSVSGLSLSGTVTTSGSLTLGGSLSITGPQVTAALGYTPVNTTGTNASGTWDISITGSSGDTELAINCTNAVGYNQSWQTVTGSRLPDTTYTNTTGKPIQIMITGYSETTFSNFYINGILMGTFEGQGAFSTISPIIPNGSTYRLTDGGTLLILFWVELR